jgi:hypothetical protein
MMRAVRILSAFALLGLICGPAHAAPGKVGKSYSAGNRVRESRSFVLTDGQSKIDFARPFIVPGTDSVTVNGVPLRRGDDYRINTLKGSIVLVKPAVAGDRLVARFSRYPLPFFPVFAAHVAEGASSLPLEVTRPPLAQSRERRVAEPYQLRLSGSKTVGVSIGSNKDLGLDQSLKVTMVGKVAKDLEVNAFLTDDNFPVQPEGNTEELKYLDRVYVQVKSRHAEVQLGDFSSGLSWSRFSAFQRELRGVTANVGVLNQSFFVGGGVTKGRFKTVSFQGREGVQGPYELLPAQRFNGVVILAGTERVYCNGRLLKRGSENDYTIDYGRGAVTFVERVPVTDDSEIVIDYEISEDSFERTTLLAGWTSARFGDVLGLRAFFFQEADDSGNPVSGALSASDRDTLASAGDDSSKAFSSGIEHVEAGKGDYVLADSLPTHYEFDDTTGAADYRLEFYEVKAGTGDYRTDGFSRRGAVKYRYTGAGKGDFRIGRFLPLPERLRLFSLGASAGKGAFFLDAEGNVSVHDKNLSSSVDDGDNAGKALRLEGGVKDIRVPAARLLLSGEFSTLDDRFTSPDKPRESYFYRDWGLEGLPLAGRENIGGARIGLKGNQAWHIDGSYLSLSRGSALAARKGDVGAGLGAMDSRGLAVRAFNSSAGNERERRFAQGSGIFSFWHVAPQLTLESERYRVLSAASPDTGRFYRQGVFSLAGRNVGAYRANLSLSRRETDFLDSTRTQWRHERENDEIGFDGGYSAGGRILELLFNHRNNRQPQSGETSSDNLARVRGRDAWEKAGIAADVGYRIGSGEERTRRRAVVFVGENQGDYDKEGREVGQKRGDYMLIYLPGADKERVRTVEFSMQVSTGAGVRGIGGEQGNGGLIGALKREVSLDHSFSVIEKSRTGDLFGLYTLRSSLLQRDDVTVYGINKLREECTLFNSSNIFKLRLTYSREDEEDNRSEGSSIEAFMREFRVRAESAPLNALAITWEAGTSLKTRTAGDLSEQQYRVETLSGAQVLHYRLNPSTRFSFELGAEKRSDAVSEANQVSYMATPSLSSSVGQGFNAAALLRFTYTDAASDAGEGKPLFFLEQGMREDWSLMGQYRFSRNVSFGLSYTGRREKDYTGEVKTVHDLKMESRAYF